MVAVIDDSLTRLYAAADLAPNAGGVTAQLGEQLARRQVDVAATLLMQAPEPVMGEPETPRQPRQARPPREGETSPFLDLFRGEPAPGEEFDMDHLPPSEEGSNPPDSDQ